MWQKPILFAHDRKGNSTETCQRNKFIDAISQLVTTIHTYRFCKPGSCESCQPVQPIALERAQGDVPTKSGEDKSQGPNIYG